MNTQRMRQTKIVESFSRSVMQPCLSCGKNYSNTSHKMPHYYQYHFCKAKFILQKYGSNLDEIS